jgi:hypothetical protein
MEKIALVVPVYKNFEGFAELMYSVDEVVLPCVQPNWRENVGVSAGWNSGLRYAKAEGCTHALVCNDDIVLEPLTIRKLIDGLNVGFDLISAINARDNKTDDRPRYPETPDFSCFMVNPQTFVDKFGEFDEEFTPAYFEDNDMAYRIKIGGGLYACRTDAGMFHKGSVTQNWGGYPVVTGQMFEKNKEYYKLKWGGMPGAERFLTPFGT